MAISITEPRTDCGFLFAFNTNKFKIEGLSSGQSVTFTITDQGGNVVADDTRTASTDGEIEINISTYLQGLFYGNTTNQFQNTQDCDVEVRFDATTAENYQYSVVFGAMNYDDVLTPRTYNVHWWANMPQEHWFFRSNAGTYYFYEDIDEPEVATIDDSSIGLEHKNISTWLQQGDIVCTAVKDIYRRNLVWVRITHNFIRHDETDGLFLRWIDRLGRWQYWMFNKGSETRQASEYGSDLPLYYNVNSVDAYTTRLQGKNVTKSVNACAPLVDKETFDTLCDVVSSPHVSLYHEGEWLPININAQSSTWDIDKNAKLQDFAITIVYPNIETQKL